MKNFKINTNQAPLSDADIAKGKDFGQLVKAYKAAKIPFYKMPKIWLGSSALVAAGVAIFIVISKLTTPVLPAAFINPPLASADIKSTTYVLNAQADSTITYPTGSRIHVPANAFRDKKGNVIKGNVELHYREFKKPVDAFLAGIPMTYDSAGQQFNFETAGMMEISASLNGEGLQTNPAALVKVDMVSENKDDRFNTYYLDTIEKKWKYQVQANYNPDVKFNLVDSTGTHTIDLGGNRDNTQKPPSAMPNESRKVEAIENEIAQLQKQAPVAPKKADASKPRFSIKVDETEFPEIAVYKGVKFQVEDKNYKEDKAGITWSDIDLKRIPGSPKYKITFINPDERYVVIAVPVFGDKDYAAANSLYNQKYNEYEAALTKKKEDAAKMKADLLAKEKAQREEARAEAKKDAEQRKQDLRAMTEQENEARREYMRQVAEQNLVVRSFVVSDFGYWNSDHPCALPPGATLVKLNLIDSKTKAPLAVQACYLVEKERNVLFEYYPSGYSPNNLSNFRYDSNKQNGVWAITTDNKIAVAKYNEFKTAKRNGNDLELEVTMLDKSLKTTEEVRHYLEL